MFTVLSKLHEYLRDLVVPLVTHMSVILKSDHIIRFGKLIANAKLGHESRIIAAFLYISRKVLYLLLDIQFHS